MPRLQSHFGGVDFIYNVEDVLFALFAKLDKIFEGSFSYQEHNPINSPFPQAHPTYNSNPPPKPDNHSLNEFSQPPGRLNKLLGKLRKLPGMGYAKKLARQALALRTTGLAKKRKLTLFFGSVLLIIVPIAIITFKNLSAAEAAWWNDNWQYRRRVLVTNNTSAESNVYIAFSGSSTIDTSDTTKFQTDCGDLKFISSNGAPLRHYISSGCGSSNTVVHVLFESFMSGPQVIYYYFGNPEAANGGEGSGFSTQATNYTIGAIGSEEVGPGPVAHWKFDEGYGTEAQDSSGRKHNLDFPQGNYQISNLEQQINIVDQEYSSTTVSYAPTNGSLGWVKWDGSKYSNETLYFEVVVKTSAAGNYISTPYLTTGTLLDVALQLDGSGFPVIAFLDDTNNDLIVVHCNDVNCAGGNESIENPVSDADIAYDNDGGGVRDYIDLDLDGSGNPVIGYATWDSDSGAFGQFYLWMSHCNDPNCAGGDDSNEKVSVGGGRGVDVILDGSGYPVISAQYSDSTTLALQVIRCNDVNCSGGNENVDFPRGGLGTTNKGSRTRIALDGSGYPMVPHIDDAGYDLAFMHCNDLYCDGTNETINMIDNGGITAQAGRHVRMVLDSSSYPVMVWRRQSATYGLRFVHCNDLNCASETPTTLETGASMAYGMGLALDGSGYPVIAYDDSGNANLKVMHCNDANCAGSNESITSPGTTGNTGDMPDLRLDGSGNPVIAYYDTTTTQMKLMHCTNNNCTAGGSVSAALFDQSGNRVSGAEIIATDASHTRYRTGPITLQDGTNYTVRIQANGAAPTSYIQAARLVVVQNSAVTDTQSQIEVGNSQNSFTNTAYSALTDNKIFKYDQDAYSPTPEISGDVEFHASLQIADAGDSVYAQLYNNTNGQQVAELSHAGNTTWTLKTAANVDSDSDWDTINDDEYVVRVRCNDDNGGGCSGSIANAKIVLNQSDSTSIEKLERYHNYINTKATETGASYVAQEYKNLFTRGSFTADTIEYFLEATLKNNGGTSNARLTPGSLGSVSGSASYSLQRSSAITLNDGTAYDTEIAYADVANSTLVTKMDSSTGLSWKNEDSCYKNNCIETSEGGALSISDESDLDVTGSRGLTITGRFRHSEMTSDTQVLISKYESSGGDGGYKVYLEGSGDLVFGIDDDNSDFPEDSVSSSTANYDDNRWHQFTAVKDGSTGIYLYIDGEPIDSDEAISASGTLANNDTFYIGVDGDSISNPYTGFVDEVKIYPYARSADEAKVDFTGGSVVFSSSSIVSSTGLLGYWKLDETGGNAADSSGNNKTLANNGITTYVTGKYGNGSEHVPASSQYLMASSTIDGVKTISFWVNPDNSTNYYLQLTPSAYITSSSGTISVSGFSDSTTYVNGVESTTLSADTWSLVTVTTTTAINATNFRIGYANSNYYDGTFDEARLYNLTLTASEVFDLYNWPPGLLGYWPLDEGDGTSSVYDRSGNGNSGTLTGFTQDGWTYGKFGNALNFDGTNDRIAISDNSLLDFDGSANFTVEAWIQHDGTASTTQRILSKANTTTGGYKLYMDNSGDICFVTDDDSTWDTDDSACTSAVDYDDNAWHHVAGVKTGTSKLELFVDGESVASDASIADPNTLANSGSLYIGVDFDGTGGYFDGKIDEIRLYSYARDIKQIVTDMNAGHPVPGSPVGSAFGHWKFDEQYGGSGSTIYDIGYGGNNGTLSSGSGSTPTRTLNGMYDRALSFDGSDWATVADSPFDLTSGDFTITAWALDSSTTSAQLVSKRSSTTSGYALTVGGAGEVYCQTVDAGGVDSSYTAAGETSSSYWRHLAIVRDGTSCRVYVDGIDKTTTVSSHSDPATNNNALTIGSSTDKAESYNGKLDDVRFYTSALTPSEIAQVANQGKATVLGSLGNTTSSLAAYSRPRSADRGYCQPGDSDMTCAPSGEWKLTENTGSAVYDSSGNNRHGNLGAGDSSPAWSMGIKNPYNNSFTEPYLVFDGSNDYVSIGTGPSMNSIEFWVYPETTTEYFINISGSSDYIWLNAGTLTATGFSTPQYYVDGRRTSTPTLVADRWQHVAIWSSFSKSPTTMEIGRTQGTNYLEGKISDVKTYSYTLDDEQVNWHYNRGKPLGYWKLDECEGTTAYDNTHNNLDGTVTIGAGGDNTSAGTCSSGTSTEAWNNGTTGRFNYSLDFDGTNDYIEMSDNSLLSFPETRAAFSISAWIKLDPAATGDSTIFSKYDAQNNEVEYSFFVDSDNNELNFWLDDDGNPTDTWKTSTADNVLTDGTWHHVVVTADIYNNSIYFYIDGTQYTKTNDQGSSMATIPNLTEPARIGAMRCSDGNLCNFWNGQLDDVKVYNNDLTSQQVRLDYNQGSAVRFGPTSGAP